MVSRLLRIGLAFAFFYAALASFFDPNSWIGFYPDFLRNLFAETFLLTAFSIFEIVLAIWLLSGRFLFWASLVSAGALTGIVIFNLPQMDIIFRDISLVFASLGLAKLAKEQKYMVS